MANYTPNSAVPNNSKNAETVKEVSERITKDLEVALKDVDITNYTETIELDLGYDENQYEILIQQCSCGEIKMNVRCYDPQSECSIWYEKLKSSDEIIDIFLEEFDMDNGREEFLYNVINDQYEKGISPKEDYTKDDEYFWITLFEKCNAWNIETSWFLNRYWKPALDKWIEDHPNWEREIKVNV